MHDALIERDRQACPETGWFAYLAALVVEGGEVTTSEERGRALTLAHDFIHQHRETAESAGMRPDHLLKLPSRLGAGDGGVAFQWRDGTRVEGFLPGAVVACGPLGFRTVHLFEEDGNARALVGRARSEALDGFDIPALAKGCGS